MSAPPVLPHNLLMPINPNSAITAQAVRRLQQEMYANAKQAQTTLGGGCHGHLGMLMPPDVYSTIASTPYILPDTPPPDPSFFTVTLGQGWDWR